MVVNTLTNMYVKYGRIYKCQELFDKMHNANIIPYNSMIGGYTIHIYRKYYLKIFDLMKHLRTKSNSITFVYMFCLHVAIQV